MTIQCIRDRDFKAKAEAIRSHYKQAVERNELSVSCVRKAMAAEKILVYL